MNFPVPSDSTEYRIEQEITARESRIQRSTTVLPPPPSPVLSVSDVLPEGPHSTYYSQQRHQGYWRRSAGSNNGGFYSLRGFSANTNGHQFVFFNCVTTVPLGLQLTSRGVNIMDPRNGFGGSSQGQFFRHNHQGQGGQGQSGSSQTVNHGNSILNFYFVNSGQYELNLSGSGFLGYGGQSAGVPQPTSYQDQGPAFPFNAGNASSNGLIAGSQQMFHPASYMHTATGGFNGCVRGQNGAQPRPSDYNPGPPQHQFSMIPTSPPPQVSTPVRPAPSIVPGPSCGHCTAFAPVQPSNAFHQYREGNPGYLSLSQSRGSLDNYDDIYEEDEFRYGSQGQGSQKAASFGVGPNHFNGQQ